MGVRARNGSDRLRTIWTPEMDRYFIDLLLEQVSKGNKFDDHLFSKRAWKHMTALFSMKFNFQYEKDVLKNRHKTLRNLYKAVKKLLDQNGFSWDESRQMVTADNNVWDEYIKMHPDSRTFRIKTIPYYENLCLIYGDASIEEKGDNVPKSLPDSAEIETIEDAQAKSISEGAFETFHEITVDEDYNISVSNMMVDDSAAKELMDEVHQALINVKGSNRTRTYWQPPMDRYFIDLMLEHMQKGNQIDGVFRKQAWTDMITSFNGKFGFNYDMDVLKNRYKTLRRQHNVIKNLLELPGFSWDDTRQMVTADDYVWQDYIKMHTDARQFMTRPVPYYKDLCKICCDQNFDESDCFSAQCLELQNDLQLPRTSQSCRSPAESASIEDEIDALESADTSSKSVLLNQKKKRQSENQSNSSNSKKVRGEEEGVATETAVSSLSDKRKDEKDETSNCVTIENVIKAVQDLPDMDEELILDACDFLEDEMKAKTFMALDVKLRKKWLLRKLRP
ncbi:L10-interacting MYB domain-containing protein [Euphorbia lathyris]|uniref:L10-interacting MYB domain-containing protein n=1 Tax=Euphorbia lathyris TaxID=212925 RepID=UPI0033132D1D